MERKERKERKRSLIVYLAAGLLIWTFAAPFRAEAKSPRVQVAGKTPSAAEDRRAVERTSAVSSVTEHCAGWELVRYEGKRVYLCRPVCKEPIEAEFQKHLGSSPTTGKAHARPLYLCCAAVPCEKHPSSSSGEYDIRPRGGKTQHRS
jgi:hypothetical protein